MTTVCLDVVLLIMAEMAAAELEVEEEVGADLTFFQKVFQTMQRAHEGTLLRPIAGSCSDLVLGLRPRVGSTTEFASMTYIRDRCAWGATERQQRIRPRLRRSTAGFT